MSCLNLFLQFIPDVLFVKIFNNYSFIFPCGDGFIHINIHKHFIFKKYKKFRDNTKKLINALIINGKLEPYGNA